MLLSTLAFTHVHVFFCAWAVSAFLFSACVCWQGWKGAGLGRGRILSLFVCVCVGGGFGFVAFSFP